MGNRILVAGAGHGGLSAAYNLAKAGYDVTVYEKNAEKDLGYEWCDYFDMKSFAAAGFPLPPTGVTDKVPIAYYCPDLNIPPLCKPNQPGYDMYMPRKELYRHLIKHCKKSGVKFNFECPVSGPLVLGNRVVGIKTPDGDVLGDLIIDAAGFNSVVRNNLPANFMMDKTFRRYDTIYCYRAIYDINKEEKFFGNQYKTLFDFDETNSVCLKWNVKYDDYIDIFLGKGDPFSIEDAEKTVDEMRKVFPYIGKKLLRGGQLTRIPIRQSPAIFVADGYAAVGDSAMMTMPVMGSGISASLKAGAMLAETIIADKSSGFSMETLWKYETKYLKKYGFDFGAIAILKSLIPHLTRKDINFLFSSGMLINEDMGFSAEDTSLGALFSSFTIPNIVDRVKSATGNLPLSKKIASVGVEYVKYKSIVTTFPTKFDRHSVQKWAEKYSVFFNNLVDKA